MPDFEKANAGTPLDIRAADWNALTDAAREVHKARIGNEGPGSLNRDPLVPSLRCRVSWTGGNLPAFSVLTYPAIGTVPAIDPASAPLETQKTPVYAGTTPAASTDPVLITIAPYSASGGGLIPAVFRGQAVVTVDVTDADHKFANPSAGVTSKLTSADHGSVRIIHKPSGTGDKVCTVDVLGPTAGDGPWAAKLTEATGAASGHDRTSDTSGTWSNVGVPLDFTNTGWPVELDGAAFTPKPTANVLRWPDKTTTGVSDFLPVQSANKVSGTYYAGYVDAHDQEWTGDKTTTDRFIGNEAVIGGVPSGGTYVQIAPIGISPYAYTPSPLTPDPPTDPVAGSDVSPQAMFHHPSFGTGYITYEAGSTGLPAIEPGDYGPQNAHFRVQGGVGDIRWNVICDFVTLGTNGTAAYGGGFAVNDNDGAWATVDLLRSDSTDAGPIVVRQVFWGGILVDMYVVSPPPPPPPPPPPAPPPPAPPPPPPPSSCCDGEGESLELHPDLKLTVPDGPFAGTYNPLSWGGSSYIFTDGMSTITATCFGGIWTLVLNSNDPTTGTLVSCSPFSVDYDAATGGGWSTSGPIILEIA